MVVACGDDASSVVQTIVQLSVMVMVTVRRMILPIGLLYWLGRQNTSAFYAKTLQKIHKKAITNLFLCLECQMLFRKESGYGILRYSVFYRLS